MFKAQHESFNEHLMWAPKTADTCMCFGYQYYVLEIQAPTENSAWIV